MVFGIPAATIAMISNDEFSGFDEMELYLFPAGRAVGVLRQSLSSQPAGMVITGSCWVFSPSASDSRWTMKAKMLFD
jgi:hypothetical protein